eukprot:Opistho-1_new@63693
MAIARDAHAGGMRSHAGNPYPAYERAALLASAEGRDDVLADLSRVGRTVAARLCAAAMQAHTLARVLEESARGGARSSVSVVLSAAFAEFCEDVGAMMGRSGAACLSELEALRPAVDRRLDALARHMQRPPQSSARVGPLVRHLESLARYLSAIGVHMLAEAVAAFAGARRYVAECVAGSAKELAAEHATARAARLAEQGGAAHVPGWRAGSRWPAQRDAIETLVAALTVRAREQWRLATKARRLWIRPARTSRRWCWACSPRGPRRWGRRRCATKRPSCSTPSTCGSTRSFSTALWRRSPHRCLRRTPIPCSCGSSASPSTASTTGASRTHHLAGACRTRLCQWWSPRPTCTGCRATSSTVRTRRWCSRTRRLWSRCLTGSPALATEASRGGRARRE